MLLVRVPPEQLFFSMEKEMFSFVVLPWFDLYTCRSSSFHACMHVFHFMIRTHMHAHTHTRTHARAHTHTHTHTQEILILSINRGFTELPYKIGSVL